MKNGFYFTIKALFILEIFKFLYFPLARFFPSRPSLNLQEELIEDRSFFMTSSSVQAGISKQII